LNRVNCNWEFKNLILKGTSKNSHLARCGRFLKAQKEFLNEGVSSDTPREEHYFLSQKDPQPEGRQILMDSAIVANPVTARNGAAPGVCSLPALHNLLSRAICQFLEVP
jgi:hypothetical protein